MRSATSASISSWTSQRTDSRRKSVPGSSALRKSPNNAILSSATVCLLSRCWSDNLHGKPTVASSSRPASYTTSGDSIGLFDALAWFELLAKRGDMTTDDRNKAHSFLLIEKWRSVIDIVFLFRADPETSM